MSKTKSKKPSKNNWNAEAEAATPAASPQEESPLDSLRRKCDELAAKLDKINRHEKRLLEIEAGITDKDNEINEVAEQLKSLKADREGLVSRLRSHIRQRPDQNELPFPPEGEAPEVAPNPATSPNDGKTVPLADIGLTEAITEKLAQAGIDTVADLEAAFAGKGLQVKGLGEAKIDKISDALRVWREKNPGAEPKVELVDGKWDKAAYHAGAIARADGVPADKNPHDPFRQTELRNSWDAGWIKTACETIVLKLPAGLEGSMTLETDGQRWGALVSARSNDKALTNAVKGRKTILEYPSRREAIRSASSKIASWMLLNSDNGEAASEAINRYLDELDAPPPAKPEGPIARVENILSLLGTLADDKSRGDLAVIRTLLENAEDLYGALAQRRPPAATNDDLALIDNLEKLAEKARGEPVAG